MTHKTFRAGLAIIAVLAIGCSKSDFPTTPGPTAQTPLTTIAALKVSGTASLPDRDLTPISMTLIARSLNSTALQTQAQAPGTTEVSGNFELGNGVKGSVAGSIEGSLENGRLNGTLTNGTGGCTREYAGLVSSAGVAWLASDSNGNCPLPVTIQASRTDAPSGCTFSLSSPGPVPGSGSTIVINITTGPTCAWVVAARESWVRVIGAATGLGSGSVTLAVDPSGAARQSTVVIAGQSLTINQTQTCAVTVAPLSTSFPDTGGSRTLTVTAASGCEWRAENAPDWVSISPLSGTGTTTVTVTAQANTGALREATVRLGGQTVNLTQAGPAGGPPPCIQGAALSAAAFAAAGGPGFIDVTAPAGCAWSAESDVPWIIISGGSGSGPGRATFTVQANEGAQRTGTIRVAGRVLTITQAAPIAPVCTYQIAGSPTSFPASGGTGNLTITTQNQCAWLVESSVDWIKVTTATGQGNGTTQFTVAPNPSGILRQGELRVGGQTLAIAQAAPVCTYQIAGSPTSFPASGGAGNLTITTQTQCTWLVESSVDWIKVTTATGQGNGATPFTVAPNPSGILRLGELRVGGQTLTVTQQPLLAPVTVTLRSLPRSNNCGDDGCPTNYGGGTVVAPAGLACAIAELRNTDAEAGIRQVECRGDFPVGSPVMLTATPGPDSDFTEWGGACSGALPTCTVNVTATGHSLTATFIPEPILQVNIDSSDTTITSVPAGINCSYPTFASCRLQVDTGTQVVLNSGAPDTLWAGCDTPAQGIQSETCTVRLNGNRTVRAFFDDLQGASAWTVSLGDVDVKLPIPSDARKHWSIDWVSIPRFK